MALFAPLRRTISEAGTSLDQISEALQGILGAFRAQLDALARIEGRLIDQPVTDDDPRIVALETKIADLTIALDQGVTRVQRSENRVRAIVDGARKQLAEYGVEHPGLEAEAAQLHNSDGGDGEPEPLPAVPAYVENPDDAPSPIPGVSIGQLRRAHIPRGW